MLSAKEKALLRSYWKWTYHAIKITASGEVLAKQSVGGAWGVLETAAQAKKSAENLMRRETAWKHPKFEQNFFSPGNSRKVRKR
jgi:hypothetical protein